MTDQRFLLLDTYGQITELTGGFVNIGGLLGHQFATYESEPGLCFAVSLTSSSSTYGEPNLHLSKFCRLTAGVIAPFFGSAVFFGGLRHSSDGIFLEPIDLGREQALIRSVERSRAWLAANPRAAGHGVLLAEKLRLRVAYGAHPA